MKLVQISSEIAPFSKTGGLGAVVSDLSRALARSGHTVMTVSPRYASTRLDPAACRPLGHLDLHLGGTVQRVHLLAVDLGDGVHHVLIEHGMFHRSGIYGDQGGSYDDNALRFAVLSRAALEAARRVPLDGRPLGEDVLFHAHDWQASLVPVYLEAVYKPLGLFSRSGSVLTLHNIAHQGLAPPSRFRDLELPPRWFEPWALEWHGALNLLKGGLLTADQLTTVSPTFAREIQSPAGGFGLDGILRLRSGQLTGILNGVDTEDWDPTRDPHLESTYSADDLLGKAFCRGALQSELGLPLDDAAPLVGSIGRLDPQKGVELLLESVPWLVEEQGAQVVILGSAQPAHRAYEEWARALEHRYPRNVRAWIGYSEAVAHRIEAGSDVFVMPSRFEPCGLNQLYSLRYGTPPIVRAVGGLADSVQDASADGSQGTGWVFRAFEAHALRTALWRALDTWRNRPEAFQAIQRRGMGRDVSWAAAVPAYEAVYRRALGES